MRALGYAGQNFERQLHDTYHKPPIYNFEMHRKLFLDAGGTEFQRNCAAYFANLKQRLIPDPGRRCGFHLSDEEHYLYFLAHAYRHCEDGGTGLRTLFDLYLLRRSGPKLDPRRLDEGLRALRMLDFERVACSLAGKLFGPEPCPALAEGERKLLDWIERSGPYGNADQRIQSRLRELQGDGAPLTARTRARYLLRRLFPDRDWYRANAPLAYRHRALVPLCWLARLFRGLFLQGRRTLHEASKVCNRGED